LVHWLKLDAQPPSTTRQGAEDRRALLAESLEGAVDNFVGHLRKRLVGRHRPFQPTDRGKPHGETVSAALRDVGHRVLAGPHPAIETAKPGHGLVAVGLRELHTVYFELSSQLLNRQLGIPRRRQGQLRAKHVGRFIGHGQRLQGQEKRQGPDLFRQRQRGNNLDGSHSFLRCMSVKASGGVARLPSSP